MAQTKKKVRTEEVLTLILQNAKREPENGSAPYASINRVLRYFRQDIPSKPRVFYDADAVFFYSFDKTISSIPEERPRRDLAENEWAAYFDRLNKVIAYRNAVGIESHKPLCWKPADGE